MPSNASGDFLRQPPASVEAEQAVLSAVISNNKALERVAEFLRPEHFSEGLHRKIYEACTRLVEKGHLADVITLKKYLEGSEGFVEGGGAEYLASLASSATPLVSAADYGRLVYDLALRRNLISVGTDIVNDAYGSGDGDDGAVGQIAAAEQKLYNLALEGETDGAVQEFADVLRSSMRVIEQAYKSEGKMSGVSTGFELLDKNMGGLHPSDLIIIAARPGMGKTALGLNIAFNVANEVFNKRAPEQLSGPVLFFSLEMSHDQLAGRVLAFEAEVPVHDLRNGRITEEQFQRIAEHSRAISEIPLLIDDTAALSISAIRTRARRIKRKSGLALIVIDYVQLINGSNTRRNADSRVQEVSEITRGLKVLAKELGVPVIALSQLSRAVESREDKKPQLADLRESGSIEQDADIVMFIYREEYYKGKEEPADRNSDAWLKWNLAMERVRGKAQILIEKQRHGPTGTISVAYIGKYTKFGTLDEAHSIEG
ncbi:MAG: replicative DNA helicase [Rickettsiales bacterium]|jgi:replicative DNA helicase|nr:replicative DNA helicase [Rickettsiales bacterium]